MSKGFAKRSVKQVKLSHPLLPAFSLPKSQREIETLTISAIRILELGKNLRTLKAMEVALVVSPCQVVVD